MKENDGVAPVITYNGADEITIILDEEEIMKKGKKTYKVVNGEKIVSAWSKKVKVKTK